MQTFAAALIATLFTVTLLSLQACSDGSSNNKPTESEFLPIPQPTVQDPPDIGNLFLLTTVFDLAEQGYRQREFFLSGIASAFTNVSELTADGRWLVEPGETADYQTRAVVYRPIAEDDFSGTVIIEWLNVTAGFENPPVWGATHTEILRAGHAWVGVSAQLEGIEGSDSAIAPFNLKAVNPERYASLTHPGDSFSYDIFSQVLQALREPDGIDMLEGLQPAQFIAVGQSQGAMRLLTYTNAIQPLYGAFDGYLLQSRGDSSAPLADEPQIPIPAPEIVRIRTDQPTPVLNFQSETDVLWLGAVNDRQEDSDFFRLWEMPGTSHSDHYMTVVGRLDSGTDPRFAVVVEQDSVAGFLQCDLPMNAGPLPWGANGALHALDRWVSSGETPPMADRLALTDDLTDYRRDDLGNVLGGIRTPYVDAPAAILTGTPQGGDGFCFLFGTTELLDEVEMATRYVDKAGYVQAVSDATDDAVGKGFLLAPDAERIKAAAELQWDMLGM